MPPTPFTLATPQFFRSDDHHHTFTEIHFYPPTLTFLTTTTPLRNPFLSSSSLFFFPSSSFWNRSCRFLDLILPILTFLYFFLTILHAPRFLQNSNPSRLPSSKSSIDVPHLWFKNPHIPSPRFPFHHFISNPSPSIPTKKLIYAQHPLILKVRNQFPDSSCWANVLGI